MVQTCVFVFCVLFALHTRYSCKYTRFARCSIPVVLHDYYGNDCGICTYSSPFRRNRTTHKQDGRRGIPAEHMPGAVVSNHRHPCATHNIRANSSP